MLNRVILIGRLTRDPELKFIPSGTAVTQFTIAVDRRVPNKNGERETDFIRIVVWSKLAEVCAEHLAKGRLIAVDGRLQVRSYEQDGQRRTISEVVAEQIQFLDRGKGPEKPGSSPDRYGTEVNVDDDDIPF